MGWPKDAYVGQEIVCINQDGATNPWHRSIPLMIGTVYKIQELHIGSHSSALYFVVNDGTARYWLAHNFRPVDKRTTNISIFTSLLTPRVKETQDA